MHLISRRSGKGYAPPFIRTAMSSVLLAVSAGYPVSAAEVSTNKSKSGNEDIKLSANEVKSGTSEVTVLPRVDVIGSGTRAGAESSGSAAVIDGRTLEESRVFNVNEALRKVPGVNVREEEGVGLRPNIGIRGLNPTRSTKTLLLEDGLPLSFAPYGDNASYYHPPIDRYESIEVSKGSQVIRFGPQTAGGVINYITPEPQKEFGGLVGLSAGTRGYLNGHVMATGSGAILDLYRKESDGARDNMHSRLDDLNFKWAGQLNDDHKLVLRATYFKEYSQLTYSGLTQTEYANLGPRYNPFKNDFFDANRTGMSATHEVRLDADTKVLTSIYGAYFDRDWWRQASDTGSTGLNCLPATRNAGSRLDSPEINNCAMQGRLRQYTTAGIDSRIQTRHLLFGISNDLEMGVKYHHEIQERRREEFASYTQYLSSTGMTLGENQQRRTNAASGFVSNKLQINERLFITPIMRVEYIQHEQINRLNSMRGSSSFTEVVPGIGASYQLSEHSQLYGGVHKGFSPPRVEDAINSNGASIDLSSERSVNAEFGLRSKPMRDVVFDVAFFRNDFSNLVAVGSIAGGTTNYSEGKALMQGIEASSQWDRITHSLEGNLFARMSLTYLPTAEQSSTFVRPGGAGIIPGTGEGKRLPYAPEHLLNLTIGYRAPSNWNVRAEYVFVGKQYSDFSNTVSPAANPNGQVGLIDAYGIWNVVANYTVGSATLFITAKNLTDHTYIVDRTRGIQVGMPRTFQAGIKYAF
jgi:Fe(3+) dicitrate transport protein